MFKGFLFLRWAVPRLRSERRMAIRRSGRPTDGVGLLVGVEGWFKRLTAWPPGFLDMGPPKEALPPILTRKDFTEDFMIQHWILCTERSLIRPRQWFAFKLSLRFPNRPHSLHLRNILWTREYFFFFFLLFFLFFFFLRSCQ
jgi:hypothetical protein